MNVKNTLNREDQTTSQQQMEETFARLITENPFGVLLVDMDFKLQLVSTGAQKTFSNVRPLIGRDFAEVMRIMWSESFANEIIGHYRHTLNTGEPYLAPTATESRKDILNTESYDWRIDRVTMPDGRYAVVCHFYDLSERHKLESALRESENRLATIIDSVPNGIVVTDADLNILKVNLSAQQLLGLNAEISNFANLGGGFDAYDPEDVLMPPEAFPIKRAQLGEFVRDFEMLLRRKSDGKEIYLSLSCVPIKENNAGFEESAKSAKSAESAESAAGSPVQKFLFVLHDLTGHYVSERALYASEEALRLVSNPVLQVSKGIILLPLIGEIDEQRSKLLEDQVLGNVRQVRARAVVIDVTGTINMDNKAANCLIRTINSIRLLGAKTILTGITASLAQHLVAQQSGIQSVYTCGSLEDGLAMARTFTGYG